MVISQPATIAVNMWFTGLASAIAEYTVPHLLPSTSSPPRTKHLRGRLNGVARRPDVHEDDTVVPPESVGHATAEARPPVSNPGPFLHTDSTAPGSSFSPAATTHTDDYVCRVAIAYAVRCELTRQRKQCIRNDNDGVAAASKQHPGPELTTPPPRQCVPAVDAGCTAVATALQVCRQLPCIANPASAPAEVLRCVGVTDNSLGPFAHALRLLRSMPVQLLLSVATALRGKSLTPSMGFADTWATLLYIVLFADVEAAVNTAELWAWRWETEAAACVSAGGGGTGTGPRVYIPPVQWPHILFGDLDGTVSDCAPSATSTPDSNGHASGAEYPDLSNWAPVSAAVRTSFATALGGVTCLEQLYSVLIGV